MVFLGEQESTRFFAVNVDAQPGIAETLATRGQRRDLQSVGVNLPHAWAGLLAYARAMCHWHQSHRFCGRCGAPTRAEQAGHVRVCTACASQHFPRTDPAIIVLVERGEHCLLGHQAGWPEGLYSVIAGFVEPGESVEQCVVREVKEETDIDVEEVCYASSQPWPFPSSLMLGFTARAISGDIRRVDEELADAQWFSRDDLVEFVASGEMVLPNRLSIAHRLLESWFDRRNPGAFHQLMGGHTA